MDFSSNSREILLAIAFVAIYLLWTLTKSQKHKKSKGQLPPEASGALPIVGHLHLLGGPKALARTLGAMSDKHGPIFSLRLGVHKAVVVNDMESMKECFTVNDRLVASRPESSQSKILGYNNAGFGFAPYGAYWRNVRKIVMVELLSTLRIKSFKHVPLSEVNILMKDLYSLCKNKDSAVKVPISEWLEHSVLNVITRLVTGKRYFDNVKHDEGERPIGKIFKEFMYVAGVLVPSDLIPALKYVDFTGSIKTMKSLTKELDVIMDNWIDEHKERRAKSSVNQKNDFIDVMLSAIEDENMFGHPRDNIIKGTILTIILGGSDTTAIALDWIISNLIKDRRILDKVVEEIDEKVGKERYVQDTDMENLVYLQAVIKEALRLYPPGALGFTREVTEDCYINGYLIPKGTRLITNMWKLHRDPKVWENVDEFIPERWLTTKADVDVHGHHFEYLPFGSGRRACPGINLASQFMPLAVARFVQAFTFTTPNNEPIDMTEGFGLSLPKAIPLEVMIKPRLPTQFYQNLIK